MYTQNASVKKAQQRYKPETAERLAKSHKRIIDNLIYLSLAVDNRLLQILETIEPNRCVQLFFQSAEIVTLRYRMVQNIGTIFVRLNFTKY